MNRKYNFKSMVALAGCLLGAAPAFSTPISTPTTLTFEGTTSFAPVGNFYNGGAGGNLGISFGGDALAISNDALGPYYSNAPTNGTVMAPVGVDAALNALDGFVNGAGFYYSSLENVSVDIFSGLNGTGSILGTFLLKANAQDGCADSPFCHWDFTALTFSGVAQSIEFGSAAGVAGFDNVIVGVPEPVTAWLLLSGLGGLGFWSRRTRKES